MNESPWLIYGATGYTGRLVVEEAVQRGHRPVLGGRSAGRLRSLAEVFGLEYVACDLRESERLGAIVAGFDLVCHLAGPYAGTYEPMVRACLDGATSYLDLTGEISVLRAMEAYRSEAEDRGVALIPAAGFVAASTDCCARYAAEQLSHPVSLDVAVASSAKLSPGTAKSILQMLADGVLVRTNGELVRRPLGGGARRVSILGTDWADVTDRDGAEGLDPDRADRVDRDRADRVDRDRAVIPAPLADLVTAYRTTGIPNITTYVAVPAVIIPLARALGPVVEKLLALPTLQSLLSALVERFVRGPDAEDRRKGRSHIWVRATDEAGAVAEVWLETTGSYPFTAHAVVRAAERVLSDRPSGLLTPAQAFGSDFVLEIPGTARREALT